MEDQRATDIYVQRDRVRFAVKVFSFLEKVDADPERVKDELVNTIGIQWCKDGVHFICNAKIFAVTMGLKANSINTNFREHGFYISDPPPNFQIDHPNLRDPSAWKTRHCAAGNFHKHATKAELANIRIINEKQSKSHILQSGLQLIQAHPKSPKVNLVQSLPESTLKLIGEDTDLALNCACLIGRCKQDLKWKHKAMEEFTRDWVRLFGINLRVSNDLFFRNLFEYLNVSQGIIEQLRTNVEYLLFTSNSISQQTADVGFDDFLLLMLRYGPLNHFLINMFDLGILVEENQYAGIIPGIYNSQGLRQPLFRQWFYPAIDGHTAEHILKGHNLGVWMVRPSKDPNVFTVHTKLPKGLIGTHVTYDAIPSDEGHRLSVPFEENEIKYSPNWESMLSDILKLRLDHALVFETIQANPITSNVNASLVAEQNQELMLPIDEFDLAY